MNLFEIVPQGAIHVHIQYLQRKALIDFGGYDWKNLCKRDHVDSGQILIMCQIFNHSQNSALYEAWMVCL